MVFYAIVEWDEDKSLSVVPLSRLLSRKSNRVTQKWGARIYSGTLLQEGEDKKKLEKAVTAMLKGGEGKPQKKATKKAMKNKGQKMRVEKEAEWMFESSDTSPTPPPLPSPLPSLSHHSWLTIRQSTQRPRSNQERPSCPQPRKNFSPMLSCSRSPHSRQLSSPQSSRSLLFSPWSQLRSPRSQPHPQSRPCSPPSQAHSRSQLRSPAQTHSRSQLRSPPSQTHSRSQLHSPGPSHRYQLWFIGNSSSQQSSTPPRSSPYSQHSSRPQLSNYSHHPSPSPPELTHRSTPPTHHPSNNSHKGPLIRPPRYVELVEGLGVFLPAHEVLGAEWDSKTPSSLVRKLMALLFTNEEIATSSVRGKTKKALNKQMMEAIIGFAINKYPNATSEYLIRQANDKLHVERKKYQARVA